MSTKMTMRSMARKPIKPGGGWAPRRARRRRAAPGPRRVCRHCAGVRSTACAGAAGDEQHRAHAQPPRHLVHGAIDEAGRGREAAFLDGRLRGVGQRRHEAVLGIGLAAAPARFALRGARRDVRGARQQRVQHQRRAGCDQPAAVVAILVDQIQRDRGADAGRAHGAIAAGAMPCGDQAGPAVGTQLQRPRIAVAHAGRCRAAGDELRRRAGPRRAAPRAAASRSARPRRSRRPRAPPPARAAASW